MGIFIFINTHPIRPHDFWWHITVGREIINTGQIPKVDIYSYTANGQPYPSYQMFWLMDILLYTLFKIGGAELVILVHSVLITAAYTVIFWISRQVSNNWRIAAFCTLFAAALGFNDWNVRPQGITFLLASLCLLVIYQYKNTRRWVWLGLIPVCMMIWVNSHGTYLIGLALVGIWWGEEVWQQLRLWLGHRQVESWKWAIIAGSSFVAAVLACMVNPRGFRIIDYVKTLTGNQVVQNLVTEWAPPSIHSMMGVIFFIGLGLSAVTLILLPKTTRLVQIVTFIVFGILSLRTSRGIVWFGLVMAPILAVRLTILVEKYKNREREVASYQGKVGLNIVIFTVVALMGVISLPWFKPALPLPKAKAGLISAETPVIATDVLLEKRPPGHIFHTEGFGSYLIWSAYPAYQVFVDPRIELFPEKVWIDYINISNAVGDWELLLQEYDVNTLMLNPDEQPALVQAIQVSGEWVELYGDNTAILYARK